MTGPAVIVQLMLLLHGHWLTMHLALPAQTTNLPLLAYATGDGGWNGKDRHMYEQLISWGYPVVGFSSPDYLKHLGPGARTITPAGLADDYKTMIAFAKSNLALAADTPVVLVGVSRGAGLAVVAAGEPALRNAVDGVVAIGLTGEEEYVRVPDLYGSLPRLANIPLAVVQSSRDQYVPAADARRLFGPDTQWRQLHAIEARNHNFSGARDAMYTAIKESLKWLDAQRLSHSSF